MSRPTNLHRSVPHSQVNQVCKCLQVQGLKSLFWSTWPNIASNIHKSFLIVKHWNFVWEISNLFAPLSSESPLMLWNWPVTWIHHSSCSSCRHTCCRHSTPSQWECHCFSQTCTQLKKQVKLVHSKNLIPNRLQALLSQSSSLPNKQAFSKDWPGFSKKGITSWAKKTSA